MHWDIPERVRGSWRAALVLGGVAALLLVAVGCGDDNGNGDAAGSSTLTGEPIKIMTYADITTQPPAPSSEFISESVRAAIDAPCPATSPRSPWPPRCKRPRRPARRR